MQHIRQWQTKGNTKRQAHWHVWNDGGDPNNEQGRLHDSKGVLGLANETQRPLPNQPSGTLLIPIVSFQTHHPGNSAGGLHCPWWLDHPLADIQHRTHSPNPFSVTPRGFGWWGWQHTHCFQLGSMTRHDNPMSDTIAYMFSSFASSVWPLTSLAICSSAALVYGLG